MKTDVYRLNVWLLTPMLGSQTEGDFRETRQDDEEIGLERGATVFHRVPKTDQPCLMNYQVKGFLKESAKTQNGHPIRNFRYKVHSGVFISNRFVPLVMPEGGIITVVSRPLRAQTAKGERVAIARSECVPEGTSFSCDLEVMEHSEITRECLEGLLDYGYYQGLGQWRSSGAYGTFRYELI